MSHLTDPGAYISRKLEGKGQGVVGQDMGWEGMNKKRSIMTYVRKCHNETYYIVC